MAESTRAGASGTRWDPGQYQKFGDHRLRPALDLLGQVPCAAPALIYDLGCGPGNVTRIIAERWPQAQVIGVDNSPQMLEKARAQASRIEWLEADIHTWEPPSPPDLIYSNATLQWVDGHAELFPRLLSLVSPGGCFAAQMPLSRQMISHRLMVEVLRSERPQGESLGDDGLIAAMSRKWVLDAEEYYDLLGPGSEATNIWHSEYLQELTGDDPVLEWVTATGLRPVLTGLDDDARAEYVERYRQRLREAYPARAGGVTLYPFRRLFMVAVRAGG
jgi:trans-aconitate 2-methyltransferase